MAIQIILGKLLLFGVVVASSGLMVVQPIAWPHLFGYKSVFLVAESTTIGGIESSSDLYLDSPINSVSGGGVEISSSKKIRNYECSLSGESSIDETDKICKIYAITVPSQNAFFLNDLKIENQQNLTSPETLELEDKSLKKEELKTEKKFFMVQIIEGLYKKIKPKYSGTVEVKPIKTKAGDDNKIFAKLKPLFVVKDWNYDGPETQYALINNKVDINAVDVSSAKTTTLEAGNYECKLGGQTLKCTILQFSKDHKHSGTYITSSTEHLNVKDNEFYLIKYHAKQTMKDMIQLFAIKSTSDATKTDVEATFKVHAPAIVTGTESAPENIFVMYRLLT